MNFAFLLAVLSGAAGGNFLGGILKGANLDLFYNSILGAFGGYVGLTVVRLIIVGIHTNNNHVGKEGANTSSVIMILGFAGLGGALIVFTIGAVRNLLNR